MVVNLVVVVVEVVTGAANGNWVLGAGGGNLI